MPTSNFFKNPDFVEQIGKGVHNLSTGAIKVALSNTTPTTSMAVLADITQLSTGGGYTGGAGGGIALSGVSWTETGGTATFVATDMTFTASGGSVGPFRYAWLYNDTPTSPADPLIGYYDYGSAITLADGEPFTLDFGASIFNLA